MQIQSVSLGSVTVGSKPWRDHTFNSIRRAERLVRQTRPGASTGTRVISSSGTRQTRTRSAAAGSTPKRTESATETAEDKITEKGREESPETSCKNKSLRPHTTGPLFPEHTQRTSVVPFPPTSVREQFATASITRATEYMRQVREVEGHLRRQAGRVTQECIKMEREKDHLEKMLHSIRTKLSINRKCSDRRSGKRPASETQWDGADYLLSCEKRELVQLKQDLDVGLRNTLTQLQVLLEYRRQLMDSAAERARVLELLPPSGSAGRSRSTFEAKADPVGPLTPECKRLLDSSYLIVKQSELLRENIRQMLTSAISRQEAVHKAVNDVLVKKVAETISLQQSLTLTTAATRHAMFRKQREIDWISNSHTRAQGPVYNDDVLAREKINRPMVRVYQRHPGTQLPEAVQLIEGSAMLKRCLASAKGELLQLQDTNLQLLHNLHGKRTAAEVDSALLRMRRQQVDKRGLPAFLQQEAHKNQRVLSCVQ